MPRTGGRIPSTSAGGTHRCVVAIPRRRVPHGTSLQVRTKLSDRRACRRVTGSPGLCIEPVRGFHTPVRPRVEAPGLALRGVSSIVTKTSLLSAPCCGPTVEVATTVLRLIAWPAGSRRETVREPTA